MGGTHRPCRLGKIILGDQQVTLLCDPWRVAKPRADDVEWELALQFGLPNGPPLLKLNRVEQSWPTRNVGASNQSRHLAAQVGVLPTHRRVGCRLPWISPKSTAADLGEIRNILQRSRRLHRGWVSVQGSKTVIQLGGCFPSKTHKDLTSMSAGRFIRSNWIVACPISVSPTMRVPLTDQSKCSSHRSL